MGNIQNKMLDTYPDCMNLGLVQLVPGIALVIGHKMAGEVKNIGRL